MAIKISASRVVDDQHMVQASDVHLVCQTVTALLQESLAQHLYHLHEVNYDSHKVLGDLYTYLEDAGDKLFEEAKGRGLPVSIQGPLSASFDIGSPRNSMLSIDALLNFLEDANKSILDDQLANAFQEIRANTYRHRYLLSLTMSDQ